MDTTPGTRLRHLRELLGYKGRQQEFADAVGLTQQSISNMERDKTQPASKSVNKIFAAFPQVNISWLVSGQGQPLSEGKAQAAPASQPPAPAAPAPFYVSEPTAAYGCIAPGQVASLTLEVNELRAENKALQNELRQTRREARQDLWAQARQYNAAKVSQEELISRLYAKIDEYELRLGYRQPTPEEAARHKQTEEERKTISGFMGQRYSQVLEEIEASAGKGKHFYLKAA